MNLNIKIEKRLINFEKLSKSFYSNFFLFNFDFFTLTLFFFKFFFLFSNTLKINLNFLNFFFYFKNQNYKNYSNNAVKRFNFKYLNLKKFTNNSNIITKNGFIFMQKNNNFFKKLDLILIFGLNFFDKKIKINYIFNLWFLKNFKKNSIIVNVNKFHKRWNDSFNFFYNIFYYEFFMLIFGNNFLKNTILSINWNSFNKKFKEWSFAKPLFTFKSTSFNKKTDFFFSKLNQFGVDFFFIVDANYHYKNLSYFKKNYLFTTALVSLNLNPLLVNYAIPIPNNNLIIQILFIKLLVLMKKNSLTFKYDMYLNYWRFFIFSLKFNK